MLAAAVFRVRASQVSNEKKLACPMLEIVHRSRKPKSQQLKKQWFPVFWFDMHFFELVVVLIQKQ
jgi:hypothetical protein